MDDELCMDIAPLGGVRLQAQRYIGEHLQNVPRKNLILKRYIKVACLKKLR